MLLQPTYLSFRTASKKELSGGGSAGLGQDGGIKETGDEERDAERDQGVSHRKVRSERHDGRTGGLALLDWTYVSERVKESGREERISRK